MAQQKDTGGRITLKVLQAALARQYPRPDSKLPDLDEKVLLESLTRLQVMDIAPGSLLEQIAKLNPKSRPNQEDYAVLCFLDNCLSSLLEKIKLAPEVQPPLYNGMAGLMRASLAEGLAAVSRDHRALKVLDLLINLSIGWSSKLGKTATDTLDHIKTTVSSMSMVAESQISDPKIRQSRDKFLDKLCNDTLAFAAQEQKRTSRLEDRLVASETGLLKTSRARNIAAGMLNQQMQDKPLPAEVIRFLQGPWFDSLQLILVREGVKSESWFRATKLTETLIWTMGFEGLDLLAEATEDPDPPAPTRANFMSLIEDDEVPFDGGQRVAFNRGPNSEGSIDFPGVSADGLSDFGNDQPHEDSTFLMDGDVQPGSADEGAAQGQLSKEEQQKLYRIVQDLPGELKPLLLSLEYQDDAKSVELDAIESVHTSIMTGAAIAKEICGPLPCDSELLGREAAVSQTLISQVINIPAGQWFVFDAQGEKVNHIKLLLKLDDLQQLLFTNRSGIKVLQTSFDEFAYLMSSGVATPINPNPLSTHIRNRLNTIVSRFAEHQKSAAAAKAKQPKPAPKEPAPPTPEEIAQTRKREEEMKSTQLFLKAVEEKASKSADQQTLEQAQQKVDALLVGAWLRIPGPGQVPTDCKLGVKLQSADKYIFIDRRGVKVGEFNRQQLAAMLVTSDCEIIDSGIEFEDTLEKVVTGLRQHRSLQDEGE